MNYYDPLTDTLRDIRDSERNSDSTEEYLVSIGEPPTTTYYNSSFTGNFQTHWDSVSLSALKTCARYYNWSVRLGYQLDPIPSTLAFGIYYHKCMEVWHKLLARKMDPDIALLRVTRLAGLLGELLIPNRPERTKETLVQAVVWYLLQFRDDQARTMVRPNGEPAVEYSFTIPLPEIAGTPIYLCGHLDRVVEFLGNIYLCDYKTTKGQLNEKFFASFKPNTQMLGYLTAAHVIASEPDHPVLPRPPKGLIIDGAQLGVTFARFHRSIVNYTTLEINSFLTDLHYWIKWAHTLAEAAHWPANETACDRYGGCVFRAICSETPAKHSRMLEANFTRRVWDPRQAR